MKWKVRKSVLSGTIEVPASKSHTIRAILIASLAEGESVIKKPLLTGDGYSALNAAKALGAKVEEREDGLHIWGVAGKPKLAEYCDMGNSGTGLNMFSAAAALGDTPIRFDGDASLRSRPVGSLLAALEKLGAKVEYHGEKGIIPIGRPPFTICGKINGGSVEIDGNNSQYLSSLLLVSPLLGNPNKISLKSLFERPYVEMTLRWLDKMDVKYSADFEKLEFCVEGNQKYSPVNETITGDFSSATFSAVGRAITGGNVDIRNLDFSDTQGDKGVFELIEKNLYEIDLNSMPDALPALSVWATKRELPTKIFNVAQARIKETDRIKVMSEELTKMAAKIEEKPDGMLIFPSKLNGAELSGHHDHRIVMALALAGMIAEGETIIDTAEAAAITYPSFVEDFRKLGANIEVID